MRDSTCVVEVGVHPAPFWLDRNSGLVVCSRHRAQYEERAGEFGPFNWASADAVEDLDPPRCCNCKAEKPDLVGLNLIETDELEAEDFGFCSIPCLVTFVQDRYLPRALAASPSPGRRSAVDGRGGDAGGTQGDRPRHQGSGRVVQVPPTSEAVNHG